MNRTGNYKNEAHIVAEAIKALAKDEEALENFESYLSRHFEAWLVRYASTPYDMALELNDFARINDQEEANA